MHPDTDIEPGILPLVLALNNTGLVHTFSSCQGHFDQYNRFNDIHKADVRFHPENDVSNESLEEFIHYLLSQFDNLHSSYPIKLTACRLYTPLKPIGDKAVDYVYVLELIPFDQGISPEEKRRDIDQAIQNTADIVESYV